MEIQDKRYNVSKISLKEMLDNTFNEVYTQALDTKLKEDFRKAKKGHLKNIQKICDDWTYDEGSREQNNSIFGHISKYLEENECPKKFYKKILDFRNTGYTGRGNYTSTGNRHKMISEVLNLFKQYEEKL